MICFMARVFISGIIRNISMEFLRLATKRKGRGVVSISILGKSRKIKGMGLELVSIRMGPSMKESGSWEKDMGRVSSSSLPVKNSLALLRWVGNGAMVAI